MMSRHPIALLTALALAAGVAGAYPLDLYEETGITRLLAYDKARDGLLARGTLKPGAMVSSEKVKLRLIDDPGFTIPPLDRDLSAQIKELLGGDSPGYGISVLDLSDPEHPRFAEVNGERPQNPGSVGKIMVALAFFQALADVYPDDIDARQRLLKDTVITANDFIIKDSHKVPIWKPGDPKVLWRPIEQGDRGNLWTFLDWMASASSNAAASMMMSQVMLLKHFGKDYPVSEQEAAAFFEKTPKGQLTKIWYDAMLTPLKRNGIDQSKLRQGSFFTREGKKRVPGTNSVSTSHELLKYLVLMEQGRLVDPWSSLEIKRLLLLTDTRVRYASNPVLDDSAVYFKSGSLYGCKPEPGFECGKYIGNRMNYMNSVAIIETERPGSPALHYMVVVLSNVLRKNSSEQHKMLAERIHSVIDASHPSGAAAPAAHTAGTR